MIDPVYYNRDLSWLSFNERVLLEAADVGVPLLERFSFLSIYSSNLDEFYRVRMPALLALSQVESGEADLWPLVQEKINGQLKLFGETLHNLLPALEEAGIYLLYNHPIPDEIREEAAQYFFCHVMGCLQPVSLEGGTDFFPENNKLYLLLYNKLYNIPSDLLPRFWHTERGGKKYIVFLDDLMRAFLPMIPGSPHDQAFSFKITRDAELNLKDDYGKDLVEKMEEEIARRDFGLATRLLYDPAMPLEWLDRLVAVFHLEGANILAGGRYHHLKDLAALPVDKTEWRYSRETPVPTGVEQSTWLLEHLRTKDVLLHPPYHAYDIVLRFFNEAAVDPAVKEMYVTLYRMADQSKIARALISAARNGKKVFVLVELKARFDEANNIRWTRAMKEAGVKVVHSRTSLKVHAKIALAVKETEKGREMAGLLATGNLNENTARFYTDHVLLSSDAAMLNELHVLFQFLVSERKPDQAEEVTFSELLVARFNLKDAFFALIEKEMEHAREGRKAAITIKMNNLEEKNMIRKLYEASGAGVEITLLIRGICCLVPGMPGLSENIKVKRLVDRYLEHGRIFHFHNNGDDQVYLGSADWMNRNIHRRIEVCFPVRDASLSKELMAMLQIQINDTVKSFPTEQVKEKETRAQFDIPRWLRQARPLVVVLISVFLFSCNATTSFESPEGYDFKHGEKFFVSEELTEISGIAFVPGKSDSMFAVQDEKGRIFSFLPGSKRMSKVNFSRSGDYEDLALTEETAWVLKSNGTLYRVPYRKPAADVLSQTVPFTGLLPKGEYESMHLWRNRLYVLCKSCKADKNKGTVSGYIVALDSLENPSLKETFHVQESEIPSEFKKKNFSLHPSGMARHPFTGQWYILASANRLLVVADSAFRITNTYTLPPSFFRQPEGICFSTSGDLFISNEGSDVAVANLFHFKYRRKTNEEE